MIGLLVATEMEAEPLLTRLNATPLPDAPFPTYSCSSPDCGEAVVLAISGMGPAAAREAVEYLCRVRRVRMVINAGICGSLNASARAGDIRVVESAVDGDRVLAGAPCSRASCGRGVWTELPAARLATVAVPVYEDDRRARLTECADIVDMEGFAVAETCAGRGVPCVLIKGVSDRADGNGRKDIRRNLGAVSAAVAGVVCEGLGRLPPPESKWLPNLLRFTKIEHTVFSLPLIFAGAVLGAGGGFPTARALVLMVLAGLGARAMGMAMNRILDRKIDALNPRTAGRELPSGRMSLASAGGVAGAGLALYLAACWALGPVCLMLSPVPALPLLGYSLLKRYTSLCHFGIGLCMALAPLGAYVAVAGNIHFTAAAWALAVFSFCWMSGFDIIYAMQDIESDRATGVHSIPARFGQAGAQTVAAVTHLAAAGTLLGLWRITGGGVCAGAALAVSVGGFAAAYMPQIPLPVRFFPVSAVAGIAGAFVVLLKGFP